MYTYMPINFLTFYGFIGFTLITLLDLYIHFIGITHGIICFYTQLIFDILTILPTLELRSNYKYLTFTNFNNLVTFY